MNILEQAESDLSFTLEDSDNGFGVELTLIDADEEEYDIVAKTADTGFFFDPTSGIGAVGRRCEITVRISTLTDLSGGYPKKDWKCSYTDVNGNIWLTRIAAPPMTDRTLGVYLILLEAMKHDS